MKDKRLLIVLYGNANKGKTTTLKELILKLSNNGKENPVLRSIIYKKFPKTGKNKDGRFILDVDGKSVYIATGGDDWSVSNVNAKFFEGSIDLKMIIHRVTSTDVIPLTDEEKEQIKGRRADICVCACRPSGDSIGAVKALHMYCEKAIENDFIYQLWVQKNSKKKDKTKTDKEKANTIKADELKTYIENFIVYGTICK